MPQAQDEAGNIWEVDAQGNPVRLIQQAGAAQQPPVDPAFQYEAPKARADLDNTQSTIQDREADNLRADALLPAQIAKIEADAEKSRVELEKLQTDGTKSDAEKAKAITGYQSAMALGKIIEDLQTKYEAGPGSTSNFSGFLDYLPTEANQRFDRAANAARGTVGQALGFTGGQLNNVAEAQMNIGPFIPSASDRDATIEDSIQRLRDLRQDAINRSVAILGGVPDEYGSITQEQQPDPASPLRSNYGAYDPQLKAAGGDAEETLIPPDPQMNAEHKAFMKRYIAKGGGDPEEYLRFAADLRSRYGTGVSHETAKSYINSVNRHLKAGHDPSNISRGIAPTRGRLSDVERGINAAVSSKLGTGAVNAIDSATLGSLRGLAGEDLDALNEMNPGSALAGQVVGAIGATSAIGKAGGAVAGKVAPKLLGGGSKAQFGRNMATDVAYGAGYGGVSEGDPLSGALAAGIGSAGGQLLGKGVGSALGGKKVGAEVEQLRSAGIPLTTGQTMGGFLKNVEDKATSMPFVGDLINARRMEGIEAFNRKAFADGGAPIGAAPTGIGEEGLEQFGDAVSRSYDDALQGVSVPLDDTFNADFKTAIAPIQIAPSDVRKPMGRLLDARVQPIADAGTLDGKSYQYAMRALKAARSKPPTRFEGYEPEFKDAATGVMDALDGQLMRGGSQDAVTGLQSANAANRNLKTLEDAANRAAGGSQSGQNFVFTPSQLQRAGIATAKKFPGEKPFKDLANAGQEVLPSNIPDSGTAGRFAQMAAPGALPAALGGAGFALDGQDGAQVGGGAGALATIAMLAGGTKTGQKALNNLLVSRPEVMQEAARQIGKRRGLFGTAVAVPALQSQY